MPETDATTTDTTDATDTTDESDAARRRTIIRLLVGLGIGIPILVELATFVGLIENALLGGDGSGESGSAVDDGDGGSSGGDGSGSDGAGVRVGEELLPGTPQTETLTDASYRAATEQWVLTLVARIENGESEAYTFQFGAITTDGGRSVDGAARAVRIESGESAQATGTWQLPAGSRPASVAVRTASGDGETAETTVRLARIPVQGN